MLHAGLMATTPVPTAAPTNVPTSAPTVAPTNVIIPTPTQLPDNIRNTIVAYPNPAKTDVSIAYPIVAGKTVRSVKVALYSISGAKAAEVEETSVFNGVVSFNVSRMASGIYLYRVIVGYTDGDDVKLAFQRLAIIK